MSSQLSCRLAVHVCRRLRRQCEHGLMHQVDSVANHIGRVRRACADIIAVLSAPARTSGRKTVSLRDDAEVRQHKAIGRRLPLDVRRVEMTNVADFSSHFRRRILGGLLRLRVVRRFALLLLLPNYRPRPLATSAGLSVLSRGTCNNSASSAELFSISRSRPVNYFQGQTDCCQRCKLLPRSGRGNFDILRPSVGMHGWQISGTWELQFSGRESPGKCLDATCRLHFR
jgi:hypothetical protein